MPVQRILAVTFTNKAANEMKERLVKLGEEINAQNLTDKEIDSSGKIPPNLPLSRKEMIEENSLLKNEEVSKAGKGI